MLTSRYPLALFVCEVIIEARIHIQLLLDVKCLCLIWLTAENTCPGRCYNGETFYSFS
jgi:hypothetical protein